MADLLQPSNDTISTAISIAALLCAPVDREKTAESTKKHAELIGEVANAMLSKIEDPHNYVRKG